MGMFDDIKYQGRDFQTKDFDCALAMYAIENGKLLKRTVDGMQDTNFHGWVNFYTCNINPDNGVPGKWEEYNAKFTDGTLVEVVAVPESPCQPGE